MSKKECIKGKKLHCYCEDCMDKAKKEYDEVTEQSEKCGCGLNQCAYCKFHEQSQCEHNKQVGFCQHCEHGQSPEDRITSKDGDCTVEAIRKKDGTIEVTDIKYDTPEDRAVEKIKNTDLSYGIDEYCLRQALSDYKKEIISEVIKVKNRFKCGKCEGARVQEHTHCCKALSEIKDLINNL